MTAGLEHKARRIILIQLAVSAGVALVFLGQGWISGSGPWQALSAVYGGLSSVVLALISIRGFRRASEFALHDPRRGMMVLYIGAVQRFVAVLVLLGIGLGLFKFSPLATIVGFVLAQVSYLLGARGDQAVAKRPDEKNI